MIQPILRNVQSVGTAQTFLALDARQTVTVGFRGFSEIAWPSAGTFRNLKLVLSTAPGVGQSRTFRFMVNGAASAMECTIAGTDTTAIDVSNVVTIARGDYVVVESTATLSAPATTIRWVVEFVSDTGVISAYGANVGTATTGFLCPFTGATGATANLVRKLMPCSGTFTAMVGQTQSVAVGAGASLTFRLYKNGVVQDGTGGTVDTALVITNVATFTPITKTFTLPVVRGDEVYIGLTAAGGYPSTWTSCALQFDASRADESIVAYSPVGSNPSAASPNYVLLRGAGQIWGALVDTMSLLAGRTPFTLRDLIGDVDTSPGGSSSRLFEVMRDGVVPAATLAGVVSVGVLSFSDLTNRVAYTEGQTVGPMKHSPALTPIVTGVETWSMVLDTRIDQVTFNSGDVGSIGLIWAEAYLPT
jgi:hypothetical protein